MKVIDLGTERDARRKVALAALDKMLIKLRGLPVQERGEVIISIFSMVVSEFSRMVLDHSAPPTKPRARRYARKVIKRSAEVRKEIERRRR